MKGGEGMRVRGKDQFRGIGMDCVRVWVMNKCVSCSRDERSSAQ
jgi:hypothetical protein